MAIGTLLGAEFCELVGHDEHNRVMLPFAIELVGVGARSLGRGSGVSSFSNRSGVARQQALNIYWSLPDAPGCPVR